MSRGRHLRAVEESGEDPFSGPEAPGLARLTPQQEQDLRRGRRAALWVGLILPLACTAIGVALLLSWLPRTPDPVANHWSGSGEPNGFMNPLVNVLVVAGLGVGMSLLLGWSSLFGGGRGSAAVWSGVNRFVAAMSLAIVLLIMPLAVLSVHMQLDLRDAREAPGIGVASGVSIAVAVAAAVIGFFAQPRLRIEPSSGEALATLDLEETERAVWVAEIRPSAVFLWVIGATLLLFAGISVWLFAMLLPMAWLYVAITLLLALLFGTMTWFRVRIDESGVEVRSLLGWPRFRVAADDIERVEVREIHPFAEWGGWGTRWVPGSGFGIVMRTGEGIVLTRKDGRLFALTVDDAATGAALLGAVAGRAAKPGV